MAAAARAVAHRLLLLCRSVHSEEAQGVIAHAVGVLSRCGLSLQAESGSIGGGGRVQDASALALQEALLLLHGYLFDADEVVMLLAAQVLQTFIA